RPIVLGQSEAGTGHSRGYTNTIALFGRRTRNRPSNPARPSPHKGVREASSSPSPRGGRLGGRVRGGPCGLVFLSEPEVLIARSPYPDRRESVKAPEVQTMATAARFAAGPGRMDPGRAPRGPRPSGGHRGSRDEVRWCTGHPVGRDIRLP